MTPPAVVSVGCHRAAGVLGALPVTRRLRRAGALTGLVIAVSTAGCELKDPPPARGSTIPAAAPSVGVAVPSASAQPLPEMITQEPAVLAAAAPTAQTPLQPVGNARTGPTATASELLLLKLSFVIPVQGVAARSLVDSYHEPRGSRIHHAMDVRAPRGTPVLSAAAGRVVQLHESKAGGLMIYAADASDRFILLYGHLDTYAPGLTEGMPLVAGQQIGFVGTTGNAPPSTPHLHFAVLRGQPTSAWWRGTPVNPYPLFQP